MYSTTYNSNKYRAHTTHLKEGPLPVFLKMCGLVDFFFNLF